MTAREAVAFIGKVGRLSVESKLVIKVTIVDVRTTFGHTHFLVTPVEGYGEQWIDASRFSQDEHQQNEG